MSAIMYRQTFPKTIIVTVTEDAPVPLDSFELDRNSLNKRGDRNFLVIKHEADE